MANGMRQILFVLIPAAAAVLVLSEPMIRLVYQRGEFTPEQTTLVATALFWFAFSLPTNGLFLLLTRTFFSLQRPWVPTAIAAGNLAVTALAALALYHLGVGGIVAATAIATAASVVAQCVILRGLLDGLELGPPARRRASGSRSPRRPSPRSASASGTCSTTPSGAASSARSSRSARRWRSAASSTSAPRGCCGSPSSSRSCGSCAAARCSTSARYLLGVAELAVLVGFAWLGASAAPPSPAARASPAPRPHLATSVLALALLIWVAELLGTFGALRAAAVPGWRSGVACWALPAGGAGEGGRGRARPQAPLTPRQDPRPGALDVATLIALAIAADRGRSISPPGSATAPRNRDDRVRLAPGTTGRSRPGSSRAGTPGTCTTSRRSSWPGSTRRTPKSSTRSGCSRSTGTCSRRC